MPSRRRRPIAAEHHALHPIGDVHLGGAAAVPAPGAPIADVIRWIEAGAPADPGAFHSATRDGTTTQLGDDIAFTTPSGKTNCMTDSRFSGALACLVDLANPPPSRPTSTGNGRAAGSTSPAPPSNRFGARRSGPLHQRHGPGTAVRPGAGVRRLPLPRRPGRAVLRELCAPVRGPVQRRGNRAVRMSASGGAPGRHRREFSC